MSDLQFDKAEYPDPNAIGPCAGCGAAIREDYWKLNGQPICAQCGSEAAAAQRTPKGGLLMQGALYALGAAVLSSFGYAAIVIITKYDLALVAIAVGWFVGTAARKGAAGLGGRPLQIVAVAATYLAICGTMFLQILWELQRTGKSPEIWLAYPVYFIASLGKPLFEIQEGFQGIIGLIILFVGLQQAWKQTRNLQASLEGPLKVEAQAVR